MSESTAINQDTKALDWKANIITGLIMTMILIFVGLAIYSTANHGKSLGLETQFTSELEIVLRDGSLTPSEFVEVFFTADAKDALSILEGKGVEVFEVTLNYFEKNRTPRHGTTVSGETATVRTDRS